MTWPQIIRRKWRDGQRVKVVTVLSDCHLLSVASAPPPVHPFTCLGVGNRRDGSGWSHYTDLQIVLRYCAVTLLSLFLHAILIDCSRPSLIKIIQTETWKKILYVWKGAWMPLTVSLLFTFQRALFEKGPHFWSECHGLIDVLIRPRHAALQFVKGGFTQAQSRLTWLTWLLKPELFWARLTVRNSRLARIYQLMIEQVRCSAGFIICGRPVEVRS